MRLSFLVGLGLAAPSLAILVAPGSPCASKCGNVLDKTSTDDLACKEDQFDSDAGLVFKSCLECELGSSYVTESEDFKNGKSTDLQWMLYNLRYATSYCFFGYPDGEPDDTPCITSTACGPFRDAITFNKLASNVSTFDYCAEWQPSQVTKCLSCIRPEGKHFLNNYISVLNAACEQQPLPGKTVGLEGDVFSDDIVNMTEASAVPTLDPSYFDEDSFGLGAKVGVALGSVGFVLVVAGFMIVCLGKRRRRAYLRQIENPSEHKGWAGRAGAQGQPSETPLSQRPLRGGWDDSPMSAVTEKGGFPGRYFSPYSSQFSSPVSAVDAPNMQWPDLSRDREIGLALGGDSPRPERPEPPSPAKGKGRAWDGVEVHGGEAGPSHEEPPVLGHPGYGRSSGSPPRRYTLTEEDARNGNAI